MDVNRNIKSVNGGKKYVFMITWLHPSYIGAFKHFVYYNIMYLLCIILNLLPQSLSIFFFLIPNSSRQFRDSFEIRKFYTNYSITHNTQLFHVNQTTSLRIRTRKMIQVFIKFESTQFWWFMFRTLAALYLDDTQYTRLLVGFLGGNT